MSDSPGTRTNIMHLLPDLGTSVTLCGLTAKDALHMSILTLRNQSKALDESTFAQTVKGMCHHCLANLIREELI